MISVMIDVAVFFFLLFFLLPSVLIFLMIVREVILQARKQVAWQKAQREQLVS